MEAGGGGVLQERLLASGEGHVSGEKFRGGRLYTQG